MREIIAAAREGDFVQTKSIFDEAVNGGSDPEELINSSDGLGKTLLHYAAEYDEVVVFEWLWRNGATLFTLDKNNKSPVDISVLLDAKLRRKKKEGSEVLVYLKSSVLTPIEQVFYIENGESSDPVVSISQLEPLTVPQLSEQFPRYNNMDLAHVFCMEDRIPELKYLHSRGVSLSSVDDDGNTLLHFVRSGECLRFLTEVIQLNVNARNTSEGKTPAHSLAQRVLDGDVEERIGATVLEALIRAGADLSIESDYGEGVAEMIYESNGVCDLLRACLASSTAFGGKTLEQYMRENPERDLDSDSSLSVASHDDKVIGENGEEEEEEGEGDEQEEEANEEVRSDPSDSEFFIRPRK